MFVIIVNSFPRHYMTRTSKGPFSELSRNMWQWKEKGPFAALNIIIYHTADKFNEKSRVKLIIEFQIRQSVISAKIRLYRILAERTVKTPKLYFFDTGLVAYLTRYSSPAILEAGAMNGAILENYVVSEIRKTYQNCAEECLLWYYRDKDSKEIDMVIEQDGVLHPIEIKKSINPESRIISSFSVLDKGSVPRGKGAIVCMRPELSAVNSENYIIPVWMI